MQEESERIFVLLLLGFSISIVLYETKKRIGVPISPLLLLAGLVTGVVTETDNLRRWFHIWKSIDYRLVELVFLPGIIFETALSLDWYLLKRYFSLILLLATGGVVATWMLQALAIGTIYEWEWKHCLILGAVLTTTDHVAVVAELRHLHAERRFSIILQGETLLNEALVFVLLEDTLHESSTEESFVHFFRLFFGGVALGLVASLIIHQVLKQVVNDAVQESFLLMIASYFLFYLCDKVEFSGATGVAVFGMYMSAYGKTSISASVEHEVHLIWQFFTQSIESIIFYISGVIAGLIVLDKEVQRSDSWKLPCLVMYSLAIRAAVVTALFPVMHRLKRTYRWKEAAVLGCTGVKGVISIVFGLIVYHSSLDPLVRTEVMFQTVCVSTCSIFLSHYFIRCAVKVLGLSSYNKPEALSIAHSVYQMFEESNTQLRELKGEPQYSEVNWSGIWQMLTPNIVLPDLVAHQRPLTLSHKRAKTEEELLNIVVAAAPIDSDISLLRRKFVLVYRRAYWRRYEEGQCFPMSIVQLDNAASRSLELVVRPIREWQYLQAGLLHGFAPRLVQAVGHTRAFGCLLRSTARDQLQTAFDVASTFLAVHRKVSHDFPRETSWQEQQLAVIVKESEEQQQLCEGFLAEHFTVMHKGLKEKVQSKKACYAYLMLIRQKIVEGFESGRIGEEYYERMVAAVDRKLKTLDLIVDELVAKPKREEAFSPDLY